MLIHNKSYQLRAQRLIPLFNKKRILSNDSIYKIQILQTHLQTIIDITNNKQCNLSEESENYIYNSLNEGISTLFKIKNELGE